MRPTLKRRAKKSKPIMVPDILDQSIKYGPLQIRDPSVKGGWRQATAADMAALSNRRNEK